MEKVDRSRSFKKRLFHRSLPPSTPALTTFASPAVHSHGKHHSVTAGSPHTVSELPDSLDIGSCLAAPTDSLPSPVHSDSALLSSAGDNGGGGNDKETFKIYGIQATSLFNVFETQISQVRKVEEGQALMQQDSRVLKRSLSNGSSVKMHRSSLAISSRDYLSLSRSRTFHHSQGRRSSALVAQPSTTPPGLSRPQSSASSCGDVDIVTEMPCDTVTLSSSFQAASLFTEDELSTVDEEAKSSSVPNLGALEGRRKSQRKSLLVESTTKLTANKRKSSVKGAHADINEEMLPDLTRKVNSASIDILLSLLINPSTSTVYRGFTDDFMLTYRYFMSELELWTHLSLRFDEWSEALAASCPVIESDDDGDDLVPVRRSRPMTIYMSASPDVEVGSAWVLDNKNPIDMLLRIVNIIHMWLSEFTYLDRVESDVEDSIKANETLVSIASFIESRIATHSHKQIRTWAGPISQSLQRLFASKRIGYPSGECLNSDDEHICGESKSADNGDMPFKQKELRSKYPLSKTSATPLLSITPFEIVSQLTLKELKLFQAVRPLDMYYKTKGQMENAPNLKALIERFNQVSYWVATEICMCRDVKVRTEVLKHFIKICKISYRWHNYNTCLQIVAALSMTCVQRLKKTWKALPKKFHETWKHMSTTFSAHRNYSAYRKDVLAKLESGLESVDGKGALNPSSELIVGNEGGIGAIPFMGIHISDLIFIEEGNGKDILPNGRVNFTKMRLMAATFAKLKQLQRLTSYPFEENPLTKRFLNHDTFLLDEDKLWKASRICEPPEDVYYRPRVVVQSDAEESEEEAEENSPPPEGDVDIGTSPGFRPESMTAESPGWRPESTAVEKPAEDGRKISPPVSVALVEETALKIDTTLSADPPCRSLPATPPLTPTSLLISVATQTDDITAPINFTAPRSRHGGAYSTASAVMKQRCVNSRYSRR